MAMSTEFIFTPWPLSPLWPLFQLRKLRLPACPEPSIIELAIFSYCAAPAAAAFQLLLGIPTKTEQVAAGESAYMHTDRQAAGGADLFGQALIRSALNFQRLSLFFLLLRILHWTTRRVFFWRLCELIAHHLRQGKESGNPGTSRETSAANDESAPTLPLNAPSVDVINPKSQNQQKAARLHSRMRDRRKQLAEDAASSHFPLRFEDSRESRIAAALNGKEFVATLVVLGSGGHTTEMLRLLEGFNLRRFRCFFLLANSDRMSESQARELLQSNKSLQGHSLDDLVQFASITRCRDVGQPLWRVPLRALRAFFSSLLFVFRSHPRLVLVNGPGTCVPVVAAALVYEFITAAPLRVVYVESFCRVTSLSLSGSLLFPLANRFLVQWQPLAAAFPSADFSGLLI
ncbi:hypothetical protein Efla_005655 [Eimeria flavescens]